MHAGPGEVEPAALACGGPVPIAVAAPAAAQPLVPDEPIVVMLDQARLLQLPDRAANVVIGNPLIADLSIQPGGLSVITGKGYGATNFIVIDKQGRRADGEDRRGDGSER